MKKEKGITIYAERFKKGDNFKCKGDSYKTYGITDTESPEKAGRGVVRIEHVNKVEIYGDIKLRDKIIKLLNKAERGAR